MLNQVTLEEGENANRYWIESSGANEERYHDLRKGVEKLEKEHEKARQKEKEDK